MTIERIKELIGRQLRIDPDTIADDAAILEDLGADSLDVVEMLMTLEDELGITIPDDDVNGLRTVKDIADYLENFNA
ncbi:MAG: acyl carrier protein [Clostridia bacterium]|nr:acyl carrier protein [Clostridia bacterium]